MSACVYVFLFFPPSSSFSFSFAVIMDALDLFRFYKMPFFWPKATVSGHTEHRGLVRNVG